MTTTDERRAFVASQPGIAEAVLALPASASAVDRVVTGILAAVALSPGVLFGPVQIMIGGGGVGALAIDGRVRQPGRGAPRPRGFIDGDEVPDAAWVAAPALPAALAATVALVRSSTLAKLAAPAAELAKGRSDQRSKLVKAIGRRGAAALAEPAFAEELVATFGRTAGGLLTQEDLAEPTATAVPSGARVPWLAEAPADENANVHVIASGDARGRFAVACYEDARDGIVFDALDLVMPRLAAPVRRGQVRVRPGDPRPALAPIGFLLRDGTLEAALGKPGGGEDKLDALLARALKADAAWEYPRGLVGVAKSRTGATVIKAAG